MYEDRQEREEQKEARVRRLAWWRRWMGGRPTPEPDRDEEEEHSLEEWEDLVEQRIQEAMRRGDFDNLPGKGKPLRLERNPFVDPSVELANHLLASHGFVPQWIEERKLILAEIEEARARLHRAWHWYMRRVEVLNGRDQDDPEVVEERMWTERRWQEYMSEFEAAVVEINRRIDTYNLMVPLVRFQMFRIRIGDELRRLGILDE